MAGMIRPDEKMAKLAYKILKTPKDQQQQNQPSPPEKLIKQWWVDSSVAQ
jgi:hypothetical protein